MGVYANWVERAIESEVGTPRPGLGRRLLTALARLIPGTRSLNLRRTLFLASFEPTREFLLEMLGGLPARVLLPFVPRRPIEGISYGQFEIGTNPLIFDAATLAAIPAHIDTIATDQSWSQVHGRTLVGWWRRGIRRCWFLRDKRNVGLSPLWAGAYKVLQAAGRKIWRGRKRAAAVTAAQCRTLLLNVNATHRVAAPEPWRITHVTSSLTSGGAERQVCNTAIKQKQATFDVNVLLEAPPDGPNGHYLPLLQGAGIPAHAAGTTWREAFLSAWKERRLNVGVLRDLPGDLLQPVLDLAGELLAAPPDVLHCWLDKPNITGLVAAQLAGVPRVVLSLRAVNPERCPRLLAPWMKPWYQTAAELPGVALVANSEAGARDYEAWLGLARGKIGVVRNAFVAPSYPHPGEVARFRSAHRLTPATPVVACVFRLDPEKRPLWVMGLVAKLRARIPELRVLLAGCGPLERQVRAEIQKLGLEETVLLLGQRKDVPVILASSQVLLLASEIEGTPNVALEAQHFGCVPVLTDAGGSRETILPGTTGLLLDMHDGAGLIAGAENLLRDPARRAAMVLAGRRFVAERFDPQQVHDATMAAYESLAGHAATLAAA